MHRAAVLLVLVEAMQPTQSDFAVYSVGATTAAARILYSPCSYPPTDRKKNMTPPQNIIRRTSTRPRRGVHSEMPPLKSERVGATILTSSGDGSDVVRAPAGGKHSTVGGQTNDGKGRSARTGWFSISGRARVRPLCEFARFLASLPF